MRKKPTYWDKVKKELRPKFTQAGLINTCELQWEKCLANKSGFVPQQYQNFAHSLRRRKIDNFKKEYPEIYEKKIREVIRTCVKCHEMLDDPTLHSHEEAEQIVIEVIQNRRKPLV